MDLQYMLYTTYIQKIHSGWWHTQFNNTQIKSCIYSSPMYNILYISYWQKLDHEHLISAWFKIIFFAKSTPQAGINIVLTFSPWHAQGLMAFQGKEMET